MVIDYCGEGGLVLAVTDDESFTRLVKYALGGLRVDIKTAYRECPGYDEAVAFTNKVATRLAVPLLLFVERRLHKQTCLKTVKVLKGFYGDRVRVVVIGTEVSRDELILTHEIGGGQLHHQAHFDQCLDREDGLCRAAQHPARHCARPGGGLDRIPATWTRPRPWRPRRSPSKPDCLKGHLLLGDVALRRGDYEIAEQRYVAAAKAEKLYIEPLKRLVTLCKESGQLDKQLQYLVKLDTLSPLNFERKVELGEVFLAKGDTDKARACFEEARRVVGRVAADMLERIPDGDCGQNRGKRSGYGAALRHRGHCRQG